MKVYVSGPMTGIPEWNGPAFLEAAAALREIGHEVFCPAEIDLENGFDWHGLTGNENLRDEKYNFDIRKVLRDDLVWIADHADALFLLPGWSHSRGARAEVALAAALDLRASTRLDGVRRNRWLMVRGVWDMAAAGCVL